MGADKLPGRECDRSADHRISGEPVRPKAILPDMHPLFYDQLVFVRHGADARVPAPVSYRPRRIWRRLAAHGAGHSGRHVSTASTRPCVRAVWRDCSVRPRTWANAWRLDYGQLFMALDFLHQRPRGTVLLATGPLAS